MHVKRNAIGFLGVFSGLSIILLMLGSIIETNTLFFTAAAAFIVGVIVMEKGVFTGLFFYIGTVTLSFFILPNKLYCLTYSAFALYLLGREGIYFLLARKNPSLWKNIMIWAWKLTIFNGLYIPLLLWFPQLLISRSLTGVWLVGAIAIGQLGIVIFDSAYVWFQRNLWYSLRNKLKL